MSLQVRKPELRYCCKMNTHTHEKKTHTCFCIHFFSALMQINIFAYANLKICKCLQTASAGWLHSNKAHRELILRINVTHIYSSDRGLLLNGHYPRLLLALNLCLAWLKGIGDLHHPICSHSSPSERWVGDDFLLSVTRAIIPLAMRRDWMGLQNRWCAQNSQALHDYVPMQLRFVLQFFHYICWNLTKSLPKANVAHI